MSDERQVVARFTCDGCGKQYRWKRELAGRRVKCAKCFAIMIAPQNPPGDEPEEELYDLVPDSPPPRKHEAYEYDVDPQPGGAGIAMAPPVMKPLVQSRRGAGTAKPQAVTAHHAIASHAGFDLIVNKIPDQKHARRLRVTLIVVGTLLVVVTVIGLILRMR